MLYNYVQSNRHYHGLPHIADLLNYFTDMVKIYGMYIQYWDELIHAIIWHDETIDVTRTDNEEVSAHNACLANRLLDPWVLTRIIMATKHDGRELTSIEEKIMADIDLHGLGTDFATFNVNTANVRREYSMFSDEEWAAGRIAWAQKMLALPRIYHTDHYHDRFELSARRNLSIMIEVMTK